MKNYALVILGSLISFTGKAQEKDLSDFLPDNYLIFEEVYGDLNNDGLEDLVIITKGTDKKNITSRDYRGELDYNRRGILVLLNSEGNKYVVAVENYDCFSSENENGGVYFPPELWVKIEKGNLYINYSHGRYGYWNYTFRFRNSDFELIGYDSSSNRGPVIEYQRSINFLSKKKLTRENKNTHADSGEEEYIETWQDIKLDKLIRLSEIKDFDQLELSY